MVIDSVHTDERRRPRRYCSREGGQPRPTRSRAARPRRGADQSAAAGAGRKLRCQFRQLRV